MSRLQRSDDELRRMYDDIVRARADHRTTLARRWDRDAVSLTREAWLGALERYVGALDGRRLPTPRTVHADLAMLRILCRRTRSR